MQSTAASTCGEAPLRAEWSGGIRRGTVDGVVRRTGTGRAPRAPPPATHRLPYQIRSFQLALRFPWGLTPATTP
jgi:hypothetical protein